MTNGDLAQSLAAMGKAARAAASNLAQASLDQRVAALRASAAAIRANRDLITTANRTDMQAGAEQGLSPAMLDRLLLDDERIEEMASGLEAIAGLPDPLSRVLAEWQRPNGLTIRRIAVPLGVIGIIYESRPNVTADAAGLCLMSGNAVILRGGSEGFNSSHAIYDCMREGLRSTGIDENCVQMIGTRDRAAVGYLLSSMSEWLDVLVPRGGKSLIRRVQDEARVPVIGHLDGICHVYLHADAEPEKALAIAVNAKMRRTGICGSAETLLVDQALAGTVLPDVCTALQDAGCEVRGDAEVMSAVSEATAATEEDWSTEYLDAVISVRVVAGIDEAVSHIAHYGSGHTECIVTEDAAVAADFLRRVDSAIVLHNASTQFADGGEFGMGAEIGIATGRIHARGPVGAEQLTSYKYVVLGDGHTRS
ncbi:MAG: glutamate-5-semialdehyde dehydrogenase [Gammaproteobacteria bacterium]|nr:glutamate-5-semialdehyde dehydrogenase [Gammaproteobacteria bacterium]